MFLFSILSLFLGVLSSEYDYVHDRPLRESEHDSKRQKMSESDLSSESGALDGLWAANCLVMLGQANTMLGQDTAVEPRNWPRQGASSSGGQLLGPAVVAGLDQTPLVTVDLNFLGLGYNDHRIEAGAWIGGKSQSLAGVMNSKPSLESPGLESPSVEPTSNSDRMIESEELSDPPVSGHGSDAPLEQRSSEFGKIDILEVVPRRVAGRLLSDSPFGNGEALMKRIKLVGGTERLESLQKLESNQIEVEGGQLSSSGSDLLTDKQTDLSVLDDLLFWVYTCEGWMRSSPHTLLFAFRTERVQVLSESLMKEFLGENRTLFGPAVLVDDYVVFPELFAKLALMTDAGGQLNLLEGEIEPSAFPIIRRKRAWSQAPSRTSFLERPGFYSVAGPCTKAQTEVNIAPSPAVPQLFDLTIVPWVEVKLPLVGKLTKSQESKLEAVANLALQTYLASLDTVVEINTNGRSRLKMESWMRDVFKSSPLNTWRFVRPDKFVVGMMRHVAEFEKRVDESLERVNAVPPKDRSRELELLLVEIVSVEAGLVKLMQCVGFLEEYDYVRDRSAAPRGARGIVQLSQALVDQSRAIVEESRVIAEQSRTIVEQDRIHGQRDHGQGDHTLRSGKLTTREASDSGVGSTAGISSASGTPPTSQPWVDGPAVTALRQRLAYSVNTVRRQYGALMAENAAIRVGSLEHAMRMTGDLVSFLTRKSAVSGWTGVGSHRIPSNQRDLPAGWMGPAATGSLLRGNNQRRSITGKRGSGASSRPKAGASKKRSDSELTNSSVPTSSSVLTSSSGPTSGSDFGVGSNLATGSDITAGSDLAAGSDLTTNSDTSSPDAGLTSDSGFNDTPVVAADYGLHTRKDVFVGNFGPTDSSFLVTSVASGSSRTRKSPQSASGAGLLPGLDVDFDFEVPGISSALFSSFEVDPQSVARSIMALQILPPVLSSWDGSMPSVLSRIPLDSPRWAAMAPALYLRMVHLSEILEQAYRLASFVDPADPLSGKRPVVFQELKLSVPSSHHQSSSTHHQSSSTHHQPSSTHHQSLSIRSIPLSERRQILFRINDFVLRFDLLELLLLTGVTRLRDLEFYRLQPPEPGIRNGVSSMANRAHRTNVQVISLSAAQLGTILPRIRQWTTLTWSERPSAPLGSAGSVAPDMMVRMIAEELRALCDNIDSLPIRQFAEWTKKHKDLIAWAESGVVRKNISENRFLVFRTVDVKKCLAGLLAKLASLQEFVASQNLNGEDAIIKKIDFCNRADSGTDSPEYLRE